MPDQVDIREGNGGTGETGKDVKHPFQKRYRGAKTRIAGVVATALKSALHKLPEHSDPSYLAEFGRLERDLGALTAKTDSRLETVQAPNYATEAQLTRATEGADEFRALLGSVESPLIRNAIRQSDFGIKLQAMYLGLKPVTFLEKDMEHRLAHDLPLPPRFQIFNSPGGETLLFDETLVRDSVERFPNYFPTIPEGQSAVALFAKHFS